MSNKTNIQRALDFLREKFPNVDIDFTERKIPYTRIKKDLFGIIDLVALVRVFDMWEGEDCWELWGVQVCGGNDYAAHMKKILASDKAYK